jgi:hypothetical protein
MPSVCTWDNTLSLCFRNTDASGVYDPLGSRTVPVMATPGREFCACAFAPTHRTRRSNQIFAATLILEPLTPIKRLIRTFINDDKATLADLKATLRAVVGGYCNLRLMEKRRRSFLCRNQLRWPYAKEGLLDPIHDPRFGGRFRIAVMVGCCGNDPDWICKLVGGVSQRLVLIASNTIAEQNCDRKYPVQ